MTRRRFPPRRKGGPSVAFVPSPLMQAAVYVGDGKDRRRAGALSGAGTRRGARRDCRVRHLRLRSAHGPGAVRQTGRHSRPRMVGHRGCARPEWLGLVSRRPGGGEPGSGVRRVPALSTGPPFGVPEPRPGRLRRVPRCLLPVQDGGGRRPDPDSRFSADQGGRAGRADGHHPARVAAGRRGPRRSGPRHRGRPGRPPARRRAACPGDLRHHRERAFRRPAPAGPRRRRHPGRDARHARSVRP